MAPVHNVRPVLDALRQLRQRGDRLLLGGLRPAAAASSISGLAPRAATIFAHAASSKPSDQSAPAAFLFPAKGNSGVKR